MLPRHGRARSGAIQIQTKKLRVNIQGAQESYYTLIEKTTSAVAASDRDEAVTLYTNESQLPFNAGVDVIHATAVRRYPPPKRDRSAGSHAVEATCARPPMIFIHCPKGTERY